MYVSCGYGRVRWVPRHALCIVAIEGLPVASRVIRGVRGGGGARGARGGGDHAGVCPREGICLIPFGVLSYSLRDATAGVASLGKAFSLSMPPTFAFAPSK